MTLFNAHVLGVLLLSRCRVCAAPANLPARLHATCAGGQRCSSGLACIQWSGVAEGASCEFQWYPMLRPPERMNSAPRASFTKARRTAQPDRGSRRRPRPLRARAELGQRVDRVPRQDRHERHRCLRRFNGKRFGLAATSLTVSASREFAGPEHSWRHASHDGPFWSAGSPPWSKSELTRRRNGPIGGWPDSEWSNSVG